jgi:3-deoxy-D-manno-octulosonate 8-phosphate phosphatase (KDO 8-P phosphatase)
MTDVEKIQLIVTDVDGVWTDGRIIYVGDAREIKEFHVRDGLAVKLAQHAGIRVAVLSSRKSKALERRCRELGILVLMQSVGEKLEALRRIAESLGLSLAETCYIGDDLPDLAAIDAAGLSAAPADAVPEVLATVTWKLAARGGAGAFRELVERLLRERGEWDNIVSEMHGSKLTTPGV